MEKNWERYSKKKCIDCGKKVSNNSKRCNTCKGKIRIIYKGEKIRKDRTISKNKDYLSQKAWNDRKNASSQEG